MSDKPEKERSNKLLCNLFLYETKQTNANTNSSVCICSWGLPPICLCLCLFIYRYVAERVDRAFLSVRQLSAESTFITTKEHTYAPLAKGRNGRNGRNGSENSSNQIMWGQAKTVW